MIKFSMNEVRSIRRPIYNCIDQKGLNNIRSEYLLSQDSEVFQNRTSEEKGSCLYDWVKY